MTDRAAIATAWTTIAIATLAVARSAADVDQWRRDNGRYLDKLLRRWPAEHQRIEDAIAALPVMGRAP